MKIALMSGIALLAMSSAASAATVLFDFKASTPGVHALSVSTKPFTSGGLTITASGYGYETTSTDTAPAVNLSQKGNSGDEHGLGLATDLTGDGEIEYHKGFVQLDFTNLYANNVQSASFTMGSTTNGEKWAVYGSKNAGSYNSTADLIMSGSADGAHALQDFGKYTYYDFVEIGHTTSNSNVSDTNDNVLLESVAVTTGTPEPAAWSLMMIGVGGMGAALRSRRRNKLAV